MCRNGECVTQEGEPVDGGQWHAVIKAPHGANLCLSLHLETSSSFSAVYFQQLPFFPLTDSAESVNTRRRNIPKTYKLMQRKVGWALWCQWSLIKCACGWKRNVCTVFALCPPQATLPPEALYIFLTLPSHTLWLRSYPQPASTSDLRAKRPSIIFLSLCFCSRGYFWLLNLLTLLCSFKKKIIRELYRHVFLFPCCCHWQHQWKMVAGSRHPSTYGPSK